MDEMTYREMGRLLVSVCRLHHTRADQSVDKIGLFRGQAHLLMTLSWQDGMTHSEIADRLEISAAAATKVIKRMEEDGYVERRSDPGDERLSRVYLLAPGRALIADIQAAFVRLNRATLDGLDASDLARLRELLTQMHVNLQRFEP